MSARLVRRASTVGCLVIGSLAVAAPAMAHNAGNLTLPSGRCLEVGSFHDAPLIGPAGAKVELDLVPQTPTVPFDEYGVSFVGFMGNTPISPGPCR